MTVALVAGLQWCAQVLNGEFPESDEAGDANVVVIVSSNGKSPRKRRASSDDLPLHCTGCCSQRGSQELQIEVRREGVPTAFTTEL